MPFEAFLGRRPWWGGDLQTLRNHILAPHVEFAGEVEPITFCLTDGSSDRLTGSLHRPDNPSIGAPLIVIIHGLTGCEDSTYVRESARFHLQRGRPVLRLNLRGAGHWPRFPTAIITPAQEPTSSTSSISLHSAPALTGNGIVAVGYSLGGNILLNILSAEDRPERLSAIVTVSAPIDPAIACRRIMAARNVLYHHWLLKRMQQDVLCLPSLSEAERSRISSAKSVYEFDDRYVAPRNGFAGADDYYERTAGRRLLNRAWLPILMLHARDDPWIPVSMYLDARNRRLPNIDMRLASGGGHVGFHQHGHHDTWHDRQVDCFVERLCHRSAGEPIPVAQ